MKHHEQSPARLKEASTVDDHTAVRTNPLPYNVRAGKPKGYPIELVKGQRSMTSPLPGMQTMTNVHGVPVADAPEPLDPTLAPRALTAGSSPVGCHKGRCAIIFSRAASSGNPFSVICRVFSSTTHLSEYISRQSFAAS